MALSDHEEQVLRLIALELYAEDPALASDLADEGWVARRWRRRAKAAAMFIAGAAMISAAILLPAGMIGGILVVSIVGYLTMFAAALYFIPRRPDHQVPSPHGQTRTGMITDL